MSKLLNYIFGTSMDFNMTNYVNEFEEYRTLINIKRCEKLGKVILILNLILILVDITVYKPMRIGNVSYSYLFYSHIIVFILILLWFAFFKLRIGCRSKKSKFYYHIFINIILYWCVFMGLNAMYISGKIFAYFICILLLSTVLYLNPLEAFITYFISIIVVNGGLIFIISNLNVLYSDIINVTILSLFSFIVSYINFFSRKKNFLYEKSIMASRSELELVNQKLQQYEREKTDFYANISHELKTPLNVIFSSEQMMEITLNENGYNNLKINKYLKMMKQNSYRLIRLIGNLNDINKIDATNFEVKFINSDIIKIIEDITMSVAEFVEDKGLSFTFDTELEEKIISCDQDKIERIMLNLLSNAVKFTDKGGSIFVNIYLEHNNVCISVKDTGIGIPSNIKDLIFDRFMQVDKSMSRSHEGSGIGLSLVKSLVEMQNGNIYVNTKLGEGSEFIVILPDTMSSEIESVKNPCSIVDGQVERINIEFSDIYD